MIWPLLIVSILLLYAGWYVTILNDRLADERRKRQQADHRAAIAVRQFDALQAEWMAELDEQARDLRSEIQFGPAIQARIAQERAAKAGKITDFPRRGLA